MNNKLLELVLKLTLTPKIKSAILYTFSLAFRFLSFFFLIHMNFRTCRRQAILF